MRKLLKMHSESRGVMGLDWLGELDGKVLNEPGNNHITTKETKKTLNKQVLYCVSHFSDFKAKTVC